MVGVMVGPTTAPTMALDGGQARLSPPSRGHGELARGTQEEHRGKPPKDRARAGSRGQRWEARLRTTWPRAQTPVDGA